MDTATTTVAPAHTQFDSTKDLRGSQLETGRFVDQKTKWQHGTRSGPGRDSKNTKHLAPAGRRPAKPRNGGVNPVKCRRKSTSTRLELEEGLDFARDIGLLPTSSSKIATQAIDKFSEEDEEGYRFDYSEDEESRVSNIQVPPPPGVSEAYHGIIDNQVQKAEEQANDNGYTLVTKDLELIPTDPEGRAKYLHDKRIERIRREKEYVVVAPEEEDK